ncbi:MAG: hypothetical protein ACE5GK_09625 [Nitrospiria bacterium]
MSAFFTSHDQARNAQHHPPEQLAAPRIEKTHLEPAALYRWK